MLRFPVIENLENAMVSINPTWVMSGAARPNSLGPVLRMGASLYPNETGIPDIRIPRKKQTRPCVRYACNQESSPEN